MEVCGRKEWNSFLVFLVKSMWWINKKLRSLHFFHLRPRPEFSLFHHTIFWNTTLTWKLLYFFDGTWKQSPNTMTPWRGEARPGRCCLWHRVERHARFVIQDPVQKLLWGCFLGRKESEGKMLLPLSLSSLKAITFREGVQTASEGAIFLPLLLHVTCVQEVLQRFRESACGSSFLWLLQQPCSQSRAGLREIRRATTALGNGASSSPRVQQHSWIQT